MKDKLIKTLICIFIINIIFMLNSINVEADPSTSSCNEGEDVHISSGGGGGGEELGWQNNCFGFRLSVVKANGNLYEGGSKIFTNGECSGALFSKNNVPKFLNSDIIEWVKSSEIKINNISSWDGAQSLETYLTNGGSFKTLKTFIEDTGFSLANLSNEDYIVVEPMIAIRPKIGDSLYYGTAFEFINAFGNVRDYTQGTFQRLMSQDTTEFLYNYPEQFQGKGSGDTQSGGLLFRTIYVNRNNTLGIFSYENWWGKEKENPDHYNEYNSYNTHYAVYAPRVLCFMAGRCGRGIGLYKISDIRGNTPTAPDKPTTPKKYNLTIKKIDFDTGLPMEGVEFKLCNVNNWNKDKEICTVEMVSATTNEYGELKFSVESGEYKVIEVTGAYNAGYVMHSCPMCMWQNIHDKRVHVYIDSNKTITIFNRRTCESAFEASKVNGKVSWSDRVKLYNTYRKTSLLDMNETTGSSACKDATGCDFVASTSCLNASVRLPESKFNSSNLSCFKIRVGNLFCSPEFYFRSNISTTFGPIKMGQSIISFDDPYKAKIGTGELRYRCYNPLGGPTDNVVTYYLLDYSSFVKSVNFGTENKELKWRPKIDWKPSGTSWKWMDPGVVQKNLKPSQSGDESYNYTARVNYYLADAIYLKYGNGQLTSEKCPNCTFLGYGLISKLSNNPDKLSFRIDLRSGNMFEISSLTSSCPVTYYEDDRITTPKCEVVNGIYYDNNGNVVDDGEYATSCKGGTSAKDLNLEFRLIDKTNPFPGVSGTNTRLVGSNWCDSINSLDINGDGDVDPKDLKEFNEKYEFYVGSETNMSNSLYKSQILETCDLNKDGQLNSDDLNYISNNISKNSICSSNNNIVKKYIRDKNDSYNSTNKGPIYTITLTPNDIKNIRKYNDSTTYDDYNFNCEDEDNNNCTSQFLDKLKIKSLTDVEGKSIGSLSKNIFWEKDS